MQVRERVNTALKQAMKDRAGDRLCTLRLISAAIKDRDIATRGEGSEEGVGEDEVLAILGKMVKQRQESARVYEEGGRIDLAQQELEEIEVIEEFLPRRLSEDEVENAVDEAVSATGANSIRDMGRIMGHLKSRYSGQMDFGSVGAKVKARLAS
ncbi:Yqey-like protein [Pseudooceanicola marinus]|uniref:Yqey-like protein n=1 Tax=Pseudooceanicola marinus TaxID=396013 RepID=A0A1X6YYM6_9RHOB|nr:GatB/YqeY domain-containing protein [Pseudooceanicola marinus]PJE32614.1 glutamyl-tRNA amidotransferase [Pseudooceanicola marinus]SLN35162.1 Yqey-like protein [Pseudooceanicola marinus]